MCDTACPAKETIFPCVAIFRRNYFRVDTACRRWELALVRAQNPSAIGVRQPANGQQFCGRSYSVSRNVTEVWTLLSYRKHFRDYERNCANSIRTFELFDTRPAEATQDSLTSVLNRSPLANWYGSFVCHTLLKCPSFNNRRAASWQTFALLIPTTLCRFQQALYYNTLKTMKAPDKHVLVVSPRQST